MPVLYLVGTPIGNLEDISLRALRILQEVNQIAAEDTRVTRRLLERYDIGTPLVSFHEYSGKGRVDELVYQLETGDVALVSDAGMPGLSDPGYRLILAAIDAGIQVVPIPGPSAAVSALVISGLPTDNFLYLGFLPRRKEARRKILSGISRLPFSLVIFESPHRLLALLEDVENILGNRSLSIGRELTKIYEETWRGSVRDAIDYFKDGEVRGEFTLVIAGAEEELWDALAVKSVLAEELGRGTTRREAVELVTALSGWRKSLGVEDD
jgi:16S rRNA (cytidine1402-2'-O)-methyltransferase